MGAYRVIETEDGLTVDAEDGIALMTEDYSEAVIIHAIGLLGVG